MRLGPRVRATLIGTCAVLVALIATAFAVGGSGSSTTDSASVNGHSASVPFAAATSAGGNAYGKASAGVPNVGAPPEVAAPEVPATTSRDFSSVTGALPGAGTAGGGSTASNAGTSVADASSVDATRIVKTGQLTIRVAKSEVQAKTQSLTALAAAQGGYVSSSNTYLGSGTPSGEVVLRIPVAHFTDAIAAASKLGHVLSLTTSADDVTGKYVDLSARLHALSQTRSTYLTILSRARTIGATLSVQQRIDDIQQQIDQLHGQLKLLGNQSSYSTLTVDVVPVGAAALKAHHARHGLDKAWHTSWSRFGRGIDAMVGAIGPIVFALLLLGLFAIVGVVGYRTVRRVTS